MRAIGIAIATLILCLSVTANAKPKTYNWVYTIHLVYKADGQIREKLMGPTSQKVLVRKWLLDTASLAEVLNSPI